MTHTVGNWAARFDLDRQTVLWGATLVNVEAMLVFAYLLIMPVQVTEIRYYVYPFIWINVGIWAILRTNPIPRSERHRKVAAVLASGYLLALFVASGVIGLGGMGTGFGVSWLPPGWGPALTYSGDHLRLVLMPYSLVGYAALAHLVYATIIDAAKSVVSGLFGLVSCVSCTWPIAASVVTSVFGGSAAVAAATYSWSYDLSTAVFLVTVALLYWRPFGR